MQSGHTRLGSSIDFDFEIDIADSLLVHMLARSWSTFAAVVPILSVLPAKYTASSIGHYHVVGKYIVLVHMLFPAVGLDSGSGSGKSTAVAG